MTLTRRAHARKSCSKTTINTISASPFENYYQTFGLFRSCNLRDELEFFTRTYLNDWTMQNILQVTLAILKPDVVKVPFVLQEIRHRILTSGFYVVESRVLELTQQQAESFYSEHSGRFFHQRLVTFMKSGPIHAYILAHPEAIQSWRQIMGPTKSFRAQYEASDTLRGSFGLTDTRNCTHGSDSLVSALKEIEFFFPHFNHNEWLEKQEPLMRSGECNLDYTTFTHKLN